LAPPSQVEKPEEVTAAPALPAALETPPTLVVPSAIPKEDVAEKKEMVEKDETKSTVSSSDDDEEEEDSISTATGFEHAETEDEFSMSYEEWTKVEREMKTKRAFEEEAQQLAWEEEELRREEEALARMLQTYESPIIPSAISDSPDLKELKSTTTEVHVPASPNSEAEEEELPPPPPPPGDEKDDD
jgi:hypothetical protein